MKILVAPDSYKESLSAKEVADNIEKGILNAYPEAEIYKVPIADGGEGTVDSLVYATNGEIIYKKVTGPLGDSVKAKFGILGNENTAVVEMASASGLQLVPPGKADPLKTTTFGTGELVKAALDEGVEKIIVGLGGSATIDAGVGMAQALGVSFKDCNGKEVGYGGEQLASIDKIDISKLDRRIKEVDIVIASDVINPLYGDNGAAHVFGPQKGATPEMVGLIDNNLRELARLIKVDLGQDVKEIAGGGAAGGMGTAFSVFLNSNIKSGIEIILDINNFDEYLQRVNLVITGEGRIDSQTLMGKTILGVAKRTKKYNVPVFAIAGSLENEALNDLNKYIDAVFSITQRPVTLDNAIENTASWIQTSIEQIVRSCCLN